MSRGNRPLLFRNIMDFSSLLTGRRVRCSNMPIPTEISKTWNFLHGEVAWLHGRWTMYRQLYGTSAARIEILNQVAPTFFATLQCILVDEVQLTLSRLGDPAASGRRRNLTLETLVDEIAAIPISLLATESAARLEHFRAKCERIVERRNRRIAHYDYETQRAAEAEGLPNASRQEIEEALSALRDFMRPVYEFFEQSYMAYEHFILNDDANSILRIAGEALRYRELVEAGRIDRTDYALSRYARI